MVSPLASAASVRSRIAMGDRAGLGVLCLGHLVDPEEAAFVTGRRCAMIDGVSLHANVSVPARDRRRLEKLCRSIARPPVSTERLSKLFDGRLLYRLKRKWRDGTTHGVFEPLELVEKLAAIVLPPAKLDYIVVIADPAHYGPRRCDDGKPRENGVPGEEDPDVYRNDRIGRSRKPGLNEPSATPCPACAQIL